MRSRSAVELVADIRTRANEPWVPLELDSGQLAELPAGEIAVVIGSTGSGKSSLVAQLAHAHAEKRGPAIYLSLEMPAHVILARIIGMNLHVSWAEVLRGAASDADMLEAVPDRLTILSSDDAALDDLESVREQLASIYPGEPILLVVDYVQIMPSFSLKLGDARTRVSEVVEAIAKWSQTSRVVTILVSQTSRNASRLLRSGDAIGADTTDTGAESATIERAAHLTIAIGQHGPQEQDETCSVELSLGKFRMGVGDRILPASYCGLSGRWSINGPGRSAAEMRLGRVARRKQERISALAPKVAQLLQDADVPMSRRAIRETLGVNDAACRAAVAMLLADPSSDVVQVQPSIGGGCPVWTRYRALEAGMTLRDP